MFHMKKITKISSVILASSLLLIGCQSNDQDGLVVGQENEEVALKGAEKKYVGLVLEKEDRGNGHYLLHIETSPQEPGDVYIKVDEKQFNKVKKGDKGYVILADSYYDSEGIFVEAVSEFKKNNNVKDLDDETLTKLHIERYLDSIQGRVFEGLIKVEDNKVVINIGRGREFKEVVTFGPDGMEKKEEIYEATLVEKRDYDFRVAIEHSFYVYENFYVDAETYKGLKLYEDGDLVITKFKKGDGYTQFIAENGDVKLTNYYDKDGEIIKDKKQKNNN